MSHSYADIVFTPAVQAQQERHGSRAHYARGQERSDEAPRLGAREAEFLAHADSFYLATVSETGWPYVQHRGGPPGFLRVLSETRLAYADFRGNLQYVSVGNAAHDDRAALIVVDYARRLRLKLLGHLRFMDLDAVDPALWAAVETPGYAARVERVAVIEVVAIDWNCPQHITQRYPRAQVDAAVRDLQARIAELEALLRSRQDTYLAQP